MKNSYIKILLPKADVAFLKKHSEGQLCKLYVNLVILIAIICLMLFLVLIAHVTSVGVYVDPGLDYTRIVAHTEFPFVTRDPLSRRIGPSSLSFV